MIKKILNISLHVLLPLGVIVLLSFAVEENHSAKCRSFRVTVDSPGGIAFIDSLEVLAKVYGAMDTLTGKRLKDISLKRIEELANSIYYAESGRAYRTIDGHIMLDVKQRIPLARVISTGSEEFYLDENGRLMRTSSKYTARTMIVTGNIGLRYSPTIDISEPVFDQEIITGEETLRYLDTLIRFVNSDPFLAAWIDHIHVTSRGEFELIPRNGDHVIEFGTTKRMEEKFDKLLLFYKNGLSHVGWGSYSRINLKFKNQVVCSK